MSKEDREEYRRMLQRLKETPSLRTVGRGGITIDPQDIINSRRKEKEHMQTVNVRLVGLREQVEQLVLERLSPIIEQELEEMKHHYSSMEIADEVLRSYVNQGEK